MCLSYLERQKPATYAKATVAERSRKTEVRKIDSSDFGLQTSDFKRSLGDYSGGVPPLPIPNREVKPASADGTALWESRSSPTLNLRVQPKAGPFFI